MLSLNGVTNQHRVGCGCLQAYYWGGLIVGLIWLKSSATSTDPKWVGARPDVAPKNPSSTQAPRTPVKPPKPQYEFYTVLPEMEVVISEEELKKPEVKKDVGIHDNVTSFYVQVGSFRKPEDADRMTAELAFLGIEASVVKAALNDHDTRYRVRTGPYKGKSALEAGRQKLAKHGHSGIVVKSAR